jgi:UDP-glucose 4-epimerase
MVVPTFVAQALAGADIRVFGDGTQSRCFTDVSDAVDALVGIAAHPEANGEVYNVGGTQEITIRELAHKIKEMTGSKSRIVFVPYGAAYPEGFEDMVRRVPSITKLHQLTGYTPKVSLEQSLQRIIDSVAPASRDCLCRHAIEMFDGIHHDQRCQYYKPTQPVAGAA